MNAKRRYVTEATKKEVLSFYGNHCIICGVDPSAVDLAHIEEDCTRSGFVDLAPMCANANQSCQRSQDQCTYPLIEEVRPARLEITADSHFSRGKWSAAYGCLRIAAHLYSRCDRPVDALHCLIRSIRPLRPIENADLLLYSVISAAHLITQKRSRIPALYHGLFLHQVALVLFDYALINDAFEFERHAQRLLDRTKLSDNPDRLEIIRENARRGVCMVSPQPDILIPELERSNETLFRHGDYTGVVTNFHVMSAIEIAVHGFSMRAREYVEQGLTFENKAENLWPIAELYLLKGRFLKGENDSKAKDYLESALKSFSMYCIRPEPLRCEGNLISNEPGHILRELGYNEFQLIGVRGPCPLSQDLLKCLLTQVIGQDQKD